MCPPQPWMKPSSLNMHMTVKSYLVNIKLNKTRHSNIQRKNFKGWPNVTHTGSIVHRCSSAGEFICCEGVDIVFGFCDTNKWGSDRSGSWQAVLFPLSEEHWAFRECQSCHRTTLPAAAVTELLVAKGTPGMSGLRAESLRLGGWVVGGEQHVMKAGGGVSGSKQDARTDLLVYKKILHFIRSYYKHCCVSC